MHDYRAILNMQRALRSRHQAPFSKDRSSLVVRDELTAIREVAGLQEETRSFFFLKVNERGRETAGVRSLA